MHPPETMTHQVVGLNSEAPRPVLFRTSWRSRARGGLMSANEWDDDKDHQPHPTQSSSCANFKSSSLTRRQLLVSVTTVSILTVTSKCIFSYKYVRM